MLVPADIIAAKLVGQVTDIPKAVIRETLREADDAPDSSLDLIARLHERGALDSRGVTRVRRYVAQFEHVRYEAMFLRRLDKVCEVPKDRTYELMALLESTPYRRRVGDVLVERGLLGSEQARQIEKRVLKRIARDDMKVLERYRAEKFRGVGRPLINRTLVDTDCFRVSVLFHSKETAELVRREVIKLRIEEMEKVLAAEKAVVEEQGRALVDLEAPEQEVDEAGVVNDERARELRRHMATARFKSPADWLMQEEGLDQRKAVGPYRVIECLGHGGMGAVYMAQGQSGSLVAVKVMLKDKAHEEDRARFQREELLTSMVDHPGVVRLVDKGVTSDGLDWMALSLCAGRPLKVFLKERGRMTLEQAFGVMDQILEATQALHDKGIIHRDLKPENVFVGAGKELRVTLMDLGIARLVEGAGQADLFKTRAGIVSGSPAYIAPETISDDPIDHRTDIYSLGVLFYELLTGTLPLRADSPYDFLREHLIGIPMTIAQGRGEGYFCPEIESLVASMLAKEKDDRPLSCRSIALALRGGIKQKTLREFHNPPRPGGARDKSSVFNSFFKLLKR